MSASLTILQGDWIEVLRTLPSESAQMCVTSPPYWGLRDYGNDAQLGLEPTPEAYVAKLVAGFRDVRRVLKPNATLWLNIGDSYAGSWGNQGRKPDRGTQRPINGPMLSQVNDNRYPAQETNTGKVPPGLKPKDLVGIPWLVAFALRSDGWFLRSDIIWAKPNCMPESVQDRPTRSHEYIFLLSKSQRYLYNAEAIREDGPTYFRKAGGYQKPELKGCQDGRRGLGFANNDITTIGRNKRSVWTVSPIPYPEAHFATYPPQLITPCILAGSNPGDSVLDPFAGSGTTAQVAIELGRACTLIELNPAYIALIKQRTNNTTPGLALS